MFDSVSKIEENGSSPSFKLCEQNIIPCFTDAVPRRRIEGGVQSTIEDPGPLNGQRRAKKLDHVNYRKKNETHASFLQTVDNGDCG